VGLEPKGASAQKPVDPSGVPVRPDQSQLEPAPARQGPGGVKDRAGESPAVMGIVRGQDAEAQGPGVGGTGVDAGNGM